MGYGRGGVKYLSSSLFYCCFNPSVLADTSPIFCATKHRGGGGDVFRFRPCSDFMSHTPQCCGAQQGEEGNTSFGNEVGFYCFAVRTP